MKILHLNTSGRRGVIPYLINDIASYSTYTHELLTGWERNAGLVSHTLGTKSGYYRNIIEARFSDNDGFIKRLYNQTLDHLERIAPDVLHLHNLHGYWINFHAVSEYIRKHTPKVVWTTHDQWVVTGRCCYIQDCTNYENNCSKCPLPKKYPRTLIDHASRNFQEKRHLLKNIMPHTTFVFPTNAMKITFDTLEIPGSQKRVIYNGLNLDKLSAYRKSGSGIKNVGFIANKWNDVKGFDDIIKIQHKLSSKFQLNVLGVNGAQSRLLGDYQIRCLPRTNSREEVNNFIDQQDIIVVPSRWEAFGMLPLECVVRGVPILAYKIPAFEELYSKFKLVKLHNCYDIDAICRSLNSDNLLEMGNAELDSNLHHFDQKYMVHQYEKLYQEVTQ